MTVELYAAIYIRLWHSDYGRREFSMNAVVVERNGTTNQLSLIQVQQLDLISTRLRVLKARRTTSLPTSRNCRSPWLIRGGEYAIKSP